MATGEIYRRAWTDMTASYASPRNPALGVALDYRTAVITRNQCEQGGDPQ